MADNLFDQVKFYAGLSVFLYAVWSLASAKFGLGGGPPDGAPDDMAPAESNLAGAWYYQRPIRDAALPWTLTDFGDNNPMKRLTVA